ncbi:MAG: hypothetical protein WD032_00095 [Nitrospirales bacterium]
MGKYSTPIPIALSPGLLKVIRKSGRIMSQEQSWKIPFLFALEIRNVESDWTYQEWLKMQVTKGERVVRQTLGIAARLAKVLGREKRPKQWLTLANVYEGYW